MKTIFFFTHKDTEIKNSIDDDPPGFNYKKRNEIKLEYSHRKIIFCFCYFENRLNQRLEEIISKHYSDEAIFFFHTETYTDDDIKKEIDLLKNEVVKEFSGGGSTQNIWNQITEIKRICQNGIIHDFDQFKYLFDEIWIESFLLNKIHYLRHEILSPYVAFDLIKQARKDGKKIDEKLQMEVEEERRKICEGNQIDEFCDTLKISQNAKKEIVSMVREGTSLSFDFDKLMILARKLEYQICKFEDQWNISLLSKIN